MLATLKNFELQELKILKFLDSLQGPCTKDEMSHLMRLWYFSSSIILETHMRSHPVGLGV